ncbi:MAG: hypothetical protein GXP35_01705 [Actinobacteria bacterium]|nr:hypothetical protein [Actinomycetota bacterium]
MPLKLLAVLFAIVALASACGDSVDTSNAADTTVGTTSPEPPTNASDNDAAVSGPATGTCLAGDEDCQDTGGDISAPALPLPGDTDDDETGAPVEAVEGYLLSGPDGMFLCEVLFESLPPQCGNPVAEVVGLDLSQINDFIDPEDGGLLTAQGITWSESYVTLFGVLVDGKLNVN